MKTTLKTMICLLALTITCRAQDMITKKDGTDIKAKITEVGHADVKYKKWDNLNGPEYVMAKTDILIIRYQNGQKEIFNNEPGVVASTTVAPPQALDVKTVSVTPVVNGPVNFSELGKMHADKYYRGYRNPFFGSMIGSAIGGPLFGLITPISCTAGGVKEKHMVNSTEPDDLFKNPEYYNGYKKEAKKIKGKKSWIGYAIGSGISLGITMALLSAGG